MTMTAAVGFMILNGVVSIAAGMVVHALGLALEFEAGYALAVACGSGGGLFSWMQALYLIDARGQANDYSPRLDLSRGIDACYEAIRERVAKGGEPWVPPK